MLLIYLLLNFVYIEYCLVMFIALLLDCDLKTHRFPFPDHKISQSTRNRRSLTKGTGRERL